MSNDVLASIVGGCFSLVLFFLGYIIKEIWSVKTEVKEAFTKEKIESIIAQRRIDVVDSQLSDICEYKFSSRGVVEKGMHPPKIHSKIMKLIHHD